MSASRRHALRRTYLVVFAGLLATVILAAAGRVPVSSAAPEPGRLVAEPVLRSAAAGTVRLFGASPLEQPGEVWGASPGAVSHPSRYSTAGGWERVPAPLDSDGKPLTDFVFAGGALAGRTTPVGGVVIAGTAVAGSTSRQAFAVRDPGGVFRATREPGPALEGNESLFLSGTGNLLFAAVDEPDGRTGAFVVPPKAEGVKQTVVLHFDGTTWSREPICLGEEPACAPLSANFKVVAIDASGPGNAWLLAERAVSGEGVELFRREAGGEWRKVLGSVSGPPFGREKPLSGVTVRPRPGGQPLTVTSQGVWADASLLLKPPLIPQGNETADATLHYEIESGAVTAWCDVATTPGICDHPLGSELPAGESRSFAWPGGAPGDFGRRVITGVGAKGALLSLSGVGFERIPVAGAEVGTGAGAALSGPEEGWLGSATGPLRLTREPTPAALRPWPVPFRRPLTAIAPQPGAPVAGLSSQALAVGDQGQVARYLPGQGWVAESLLNGAGNRVTPRLRGVAWPTTGFAYAVGDAGAMWLWRASTGLWEPDPGAPPNLIRGNFTGIAFDPSNPERGYAVGKQGLLLRYDRQWTQEALPPEVNPEVNFTSIGFAGEEALAAYRYPTPNDRPAGFSGGLLVNDGSGWRVDVDAGAKGVPVLVAGLPDGAAAIAYQDGRVAEREAAGAPWTVAPESAGGYPVALAAIREEGAVRAILSIQPTDTGEANAVGYDVDLEQVTNQPPPGQAPLLTRPYSLALRGYLERQTATGWRDEQHEAFPVPSGSNPTDLPREPDPLLALLIAPDGSNGWAVGGETGERVILVSSKKPVQTAAVMRYGSDAAPPANFSTVPIPPNAGTTIAIGGNAQCASTCADQVGTGTGPETWLPAAVAKAASIPGVSAFVHTGPGVAPGTSAARAFQREEAAYARRLGAGAGGLPVFAAPSASDLDGSGSLATFAAAFAGTTPVGPPDLSRGYYGFDAGGARVLVLNYAAKALGDPQRCWLAQELEVAKRAARPAVVVGNRDLGNRAPLDTRPTDAAAVVETLVTGVGPVGCAVPQPAGASAYFFDFPEENRSYRLISAGRSIPTFGSGTLGYVNPSEVRTDYVLGASGFMLAEIGSPDPATNVASVRVRLIPSIGEVALEAMDGTFLRRSSPALFRGLAERPRGGGRCGGVDPRTLCQSLAPDPYVPIPATCQAGNCATGLFPEYRFSSSDPDVADFVKADPAARNPRAVMLGPGDKAIPDPLSGLLCAFNAGTTTISLEAGGLSYSTQVTVQKGSVQRPCGTVPLRNRPSAAPNLTPPPPPPPPPVANFTPSGGSLPPPPAPHGVPTPPAAQPATPAPAPTPPAPSFFTPAPVLTPVIAIVPPPPAPTVQTTPPSGTSPVTQPAMSPEPEEEEEAAFDLVHHMAAYQAPGRVPAAAAAQRGDGGLPAWAAPTLILLMALAATGIGSRRRRSPELARIEAGRPARRRPGR